MKFTIMKGHRRIYFFPVAKRNYIETGIRLLYEREFVQQESFYKKNTQTERRTMSKSKKRRFLYINIYFIYLYQS